MTDLAKELRYVNTLAQRDTYIFEGFSIYVKRIRKTRNEEEWTYKVELFKNQLFIASYEFKHNTKKIGNKTVAKSINESPSQFKRFFIHYTF